MLIRGIWKLCEDGVTRPIVSATVGADGGKQEDELFLIDSGADRTVLTADLIAALGLPATPAASGLALSGVGGTQRFVEVSGALVFVRDDGGPATVRGTSAGFQDPSATDFSILGRDVLNNFDVILSRPRGEVLLLAPNHHYRVEKI